MNVDEAKKLIRSLAKGQWLRLTNHCRERMSERNVNMDDLLMALMWGQVDELMENPERRNWSCLVRGKDVEGEPLVVKVAILESEHALLCITVHGD